MTASGNTDTQVYVCARVFTHVVMRATPCVEFVAGAWGNGERLQVLSSETFVFLSHWFQTCSAYQCNQR